MCFIQLFCKTLLEILSSIDNNIQSKKRCDIHALIYLISFTILCPIIMAALNYFTKTKKIN